jgi:hypothetical protein
MRSAHPGVSEAVLLDHLAWETGAAASGLVNPGAWVRRALVESGLCANPSEAQARLARMTARRTPRTVDAAMATDTRLADRMLERDVETLCLPIHARLESCPMTELDQAATTVVRMAIENGDARVLEDVVASLAIFSAEWGGGRWWAPAPRDEAPVRAT